MPRKKKTDAPVTGEPLEMDPEFQPVETDPLADVVVKADALGTPEGTIPEKPDHIMPKPTFTLLTEGPHAGGYRENRFDHARTVTIEGVQYEHVTEDPDGRWIYQRS